MKISFSKCMVGLAGLAFAVLAAASSPGAAAPDFVMKSVAGTNHRLSEQRGEIVLLVFTASWCGDCAPHLEHVGDLHARYRDAGVELFAVSLDRERRSAVAFAERVDAAFPVLHDAAGETGRLYDVRELPKLILVDRAGVVRHVFSGYRRGDEARYLDRLRELIREL